MEIFTYNTNNLCIYQLAVLTNWIPRVRAVPLGFFIALRYSRLHFKVTMQVNRYIGKNSRYPLVYHNWKINYYTNFKCKHVCAFILFGMFVVRLRNLIKTLLCGIDPCITLYLYFECSMLFESISITVLWSVP